MKQILKTLGMAAACVAGLFLFTAAALNAWDAEGTAKLKEISNTEKSMLLRLSQANISKDIIQ